jgi:hypothetical protein
MNTPSEVGGVLAQIANGLPRTSDAEGYRRLLTRAANHLLPIAHPPSDLRHTINSQRDARSSINASCDRWHESEIRRWEEYDKDHSVPARSRATRVESTTTSTSGPTRGRSRRHTTSSPPRDRPYERRQEDTCGVSTLTPRLRAIQWPPTSKSRTSTSMSPSRTQGLVGHLHDRRLDRWGDGRRNDSVFAHRPRARRTAVAPTSATTLHLRLERLQSVFYRQLLVSL